MKSLVKTIQNTAFQQSLWQKGSGIVLGVSGGPDSACLLDVMDKIAAKADLRLIIAHVNYRLRGKDSDRDEKFVRQLAKKHGLIAYVLQPKVGIKASENELRDIRYDFFEKIRKENNFDLIAVAHNADDQVETFLMRIIRGAGLQGLSAMKYKSGKIIRPLLGISRQEILEYLKQDKLSFRTDRTNLTDVFLRNKVRNRLVPFLEKKFNPKIRETIFFATRSIADDLEFLEETARKAGAKDGLSVRKLLLLHPALQRRVLLHYIESQKAGRQDIEAAHIEEALKALRSTKSKNQVVVFKGLKLARKGDKVVISQYK